jgi:hypothetical protein
MIMHQATEDPNTRASVNLPGWFGILVGPFKGFSVSC